MAATALRTMALCATAIGVSHGYRTVQAPVPAIAYASFAPLNADLFVANGDGRGHRALLSHPANDYNASFSADGRWIVFTSERDGSADVYRVHPDGTGLERLTNYIGFDDQGALSPDAKVLAFVSTRSGQADIWLLDLATRGLRNLTNHPAGDFRPAWSPDGEWLAFSTDRHSTQPRRQFQVLQSTEIYVVRRDGTALRRVTSIGAFVGSPSWSADSRSLLVYKTDARELGNITAPRRLGGTTQIATIDVATGEERALTSGLGEKWSPRFLPDRRVAYVSGGTDGGLEFTSGIAGARGKFASPSWSPDGRRVIFHRDVAVADDWPPHRAAYSLDPRYRLMRTGVFASYAPSGDRLALNDNTAGIVHNRVLVMAADGTHCDTLFGDSVKSALAPAWSPQGDRIAFAFGQFFPAVLGPSTAAIAVTPADRPDVTLLTDTAENAGFPSWSPDGRRLVYRVARNERSALRIIDISTRAVRQLTDGSSNDNSPSWSPCGDRIVFTSNRDAGGDYDLYTIRPDGTDLRRLTSTPGNDSHPRWSPDCEWIAFTSARGGFKDESALHLINPQPYGDIYVMRTDGSDVRRLTDDQFEDGTPTWIPNKSGSQKPGPGTR